jgi:hypothetical protein
MIEPLNSYPIQTVKLVVKKFAALETRQVGTSSEKLADDCSPR